MTNRDKSIVAAYERTKLLSTLRHFVERLQQQSDRLQTIPPAITAEQVRQEAREIVAPLLHEVAADRYIRGVRDGAFVGALVGLALASLVMFYMWG